VSAPVASIPAGLTFDCRILTTIDSDTSAAGDPVEGILRSPIRVQDGSILAPRGARVHVRLLYFAKYSLGNDFFQLGIRLESVEVNGAPVTLHAVVVEQPLLPGGATDRSPDPTHGVSPKALKNLPADVGLFSFSEEHLRLPHLDSRWITVSPASNIIKFQCSTARLKAGDVVELGIEHLGEARQRVVACGLRLPTRLPPVRRDEAAEKSSNFGFQ
jgi:hypothetical protein